MNPQDFSRLYTKQPHDETVTPFQNEVGFSLVRSYPVGTVYHKDGRRMFIKIAVLKSGFFYGVNMTNPQKFGGSETVEYVITDGEEYGKKVTNFMSDGTEFVFDEASKTVSHQPTGKKFTLNDFVEILITNHLSDRLFWKRKKNAAASLILKFLFWLSDKRYDWVKTAVDKSEAKRTHVHSEEKEGDVDPFFKYFLISRNTLFLGLIIASLTAIVVERCKIVDEFTVANPLIVLAFFLFLSVCEKISIWLNTKIKEFFKPQQFYDDKPNFIEKLHEYQFQNKFNLTLTL